MKKNLMTFVAVLAFALPASSFAAGTLAKACAKELDSFGCKKAKTDKAAFACLEKNEKSGEPNDGFSESCHTAHETYEASLKKGDYKKHEAAEKNEAKPDAGAGAAKQ